MLNNPIPDQMTDYMRFRGRCRELSEAACVTDSSLTLVRGHYFCPIWNVEEQHWWTKREDGTIFDPSAAQFPSKGHGIYTEFDGMIECAECGKKVAEKDASIDGRYAFCSYRCNGKFVGIF
jgi:hypothetical protein